MEVITVNFLFRSLHNLSSLSVVGCPVPASVDRFRFAIASRDWSRLAVRRVVLAELSRDYVIDWNSKDHWFPLFHVLIASPLTSSPISPAACKAM